jgi:hypothetical protein
MSKTSEIINRIQKERGASFISFICERPIDYTVAYKVHNLLRKTMGSDKIDIMIESGGGMLDSTVKITKILRSYYKEMRAIVPFYAKSAATYLVLSADEILMCRAGELGPLDPQVREFSTGMWIPAHSIRKTLAFIENTKDEMVKLQLADKMPPLLVGAYMETQDSSKQYLEELFDGHNNKEKILDFFTEKFLSHGYPIDDAQCKKLGLNIVTVSDELEKDIYDLYEFYQDLKPLMSQNQIEEWLILQNGSDLVIMLDQDDISNEVKIAMDMMRSKSSTKVGGKVLKNKSEI